MPVDKRRIGWSCKTARAPRVQSAPRWKSKFCRNFIHLCPDITLKIPLPSPPLPQWKTPSIHLKVCAAATANMTGKYSTDDLKLWCAAWHLSAVTRYPPPPTSGTWLTSSQQHENSMGKTCPNEPFFQMMKFFVQQESE